MKLIKKEIDKDGGGRITLLPVDKEDLWYIYNVVNEGNTIKSRTVRKVVSDTSGDSSKSAERKVVNLIIRVDRLEYDPMNGSLRVSGKNIGENEFVRIGQHHSIDIQLNSNLSIGKGYWDKIDLELLEESCDPSANADLAVVMMDDSAAEFHLITPHMYILQAKLEMAGKKQARFNEKRIHKFFQQISNNIMQHFTSEKVKAILLGSPTGLNAQYLDYLKSAPLGTIDRSKLLLCKVKSVNRTALQEVFCDSAVLKRIAQTKFAKEIKEVSEFLRRLHIDSNLVTYGYGNVLEACSQGAVETLLISDTLTNAPGERKKITKLIDEAFAFGGSFMKVSPVHTEGQDLMKYTGVAALLRFSSEYLELQAPGTLAKKKDPSINGGSTSEGDIYGGKLLVKGKGACLT